MPPPMTITLWWVSDIQVSDTSIARNGAIAEFCRENTNENSRNAGEDYMVDTGAAAFVTEGR
jgi:hypothetical protein